MMFKLLDGCDDDNFTVFTILYHVQNLEQHSL